MTVFGNSAIEVDKSEIYIPNNDRMVLRELAQILGELASRPQEKQSRKFWTNHNDIKSTRPVVFCGRQS